MEFAALVPGYLGDAVPPGRPRRAHTLNARFYGELWRRVDGASPSAAAASAPFDRRFPFPQRIPKTGFFDELFADRAARARFERRRRWLRQAFHAARAQAATNPAPMLNLGHWLLRWDAFPDNVGAVRGLDVGARFELEHLKNLARLGRSLSAARPVAGRDAMGRLAELALERLTPVATVPFLTMFVVSAFRYPASPELRAEANDAAVPLERTLARHVPGTFQERLHFAVAHRGIAMADLPKTRKSWHLERALEISEYLAPSGPLERLVAAENALTLRQTLAKWALATGNLGDAEAHLRTMVAIDRCDSTALSELGLFLLEQERFTEAERTFRKAAELGPPAVGMNRFFEGLCSKHRGRLVRAAAAFREAAKRDPLALSPHLELLTLPAGRPGTALRRRTVAHVLGTPMLRRQLTALERKDLRHG